VSLLKLELRMRFDFRKYFFWLVFILTNISPSKLLAQDSTDIIPESILENLTQIGDDHINIENLSDAADALLKNPINILHASNADWQRLVDLDLLTSLQVQSILDYEKQFGNFISLYELESVPEMDLNTINSIRPFITFSKNVETKKYSFKDYFTKGNYLFLIRTQQTLENQIGYDRDSIGTKGYTGSPLGLYARLRYRLDDKISAGITMQKDPGEQLFGPYEKQGFDFYSAHLFFRTNSIVSTIALGDYTLNIGQGLLCWQGFSSFKSSYVLVIEKNGQLLQPYTSTDEFNFFRGAAVSLVYKSFSITPFFSYKYIDGNIADYDSSTQRIFDVSSLPTEGYHRTLSELEDKHSISQTDFGASLNYNMKNFSLGTAIIHTQLSAPIIRTSSAYNQYEFNGDKLTVADVSYKFLFRNINLFGEISTSTNNGNAFLQGALLSLNSLVDISVLYRNYSPCYFSFYENGFSDGTTDDNEKGLFMGISIHPVNAWQLNAYADVFKKPWLDFDQYAPAVDNDYLVQLTYQPQKALQIYLRFHSQMSQQNSSDISTNIHYLDNNYQNNLRFNLTYQLSKQVTLSSRAEWVNLSQENYGADNGFLIYQGINYTFSHLPFEIKTRYGIFKTDDYNSRIYAYEDDVLYAFSVPFFYGAGSRYYIVLRMKILHGLDLWLRLARTTYWNQNTVSSGLDLIYGSHRSDAEAEIVWRF
jgi:hypothetical protein